MRPGPGLVVMALVFISGARRGSTKTSSKTLSSPSLPLSLEFSAPTSRQNYFNAHALPEHSRFLFPFGLIIGSYTSAKQKGRNSVHKSNHHRKLNTLPKYFRKYSSALDVNIKNEYFKKPKRWRELEKHETTQKPYKSIPVSYYHREKRSVEIGRSGSALDSVFQTSTAPAIVDFKESSLSEETEHESTRINTDCDENSSSRSSDNDSDLKFLPVKSSAEASESLDEENIFALVADDDLPSVDSFPQVKKQKGDETDYINKEGDEKTLAKHYSNTDTVERDDDSLDAVEEVPFPARRETFGDNATVSSNVEFTADLIHVENLETAGDRHNDIGHFKVAEIKDVEPKNLHFSSLLKHNKTAAATGSLTFVKGRDTEFFGETHEKAFTGGTDLRKTLFQSASPLIRINPWIYACDLVQPATAPDLQGHCSSGSLPMAWIDEGPGPPSCPKPCFQLRRNNKHGNIFTDTFNAKLNKDDRSSEEEDITNAKVIKYKSERDTKINHVVFFNNQSNNITYMRKVRKDLVKNLNTPSNFVPRITNEAYMALTSTSLPAGQSKHIAIDDLRTTETKIYQPFPLNLSSENKHVTFSAYRDLNSHIHNLSLYFLNINTGHQKSAKDNKTPIDETPNERAEQCLDYLGDSQETSPMALCSLKSPNELVTRLRTLRLRHCCERNIFTALHTIALNATLSGGTDCVRILTDIIDLDTLATRITCELAEILFRFDCRQVYSLMNQCDDCKEAYRRWVCSTLVPFFAEPKDVQKSIVRKNDVSVRKNIRTTRSFYGSGALQTTKLKPFIKFVHKRGDTKTKLKFDINKHYQRGLSSKSYEVVGLTKTSKSLSYVDALENYSINHRSNSYKRGEDNNSASKRNAKFSRTILKAEASRGKENRSQNWQRNKKNLGAGKQNNSLKKRKSRSFFMTNANNEGTAHVVNSSVMLKVLARTKRKIELQKRRRVRPCLDVCQTVEQKCPYLLPADRAPALPTQYAGEPSFLCLDQKIPETGEQLRRSSYGPHNCCYTYCGDASKGICTYCNDLSMSTDSDTENIVKSFDRKWNFHNYTLTLGPQAQEDNADARLSEMGNDGKARKASVAIALKNSSNLIAALEHLPYYAFVDGTYYYDDDNNEMPQQALSEHCPPVPSLTSRCTTPYFASAANASLRPRSVLLLWLSIVLCSVSSFNASKRLRYSRRLGLSFLKESNIAKIFHHKNEKQRRIIAAEIEFHKIITVITVGIYTYLSRNLLLKGCPRNKKCGSNKTRLNTTMNTCNRTKTIKKIFTENIYYNSNHYKFWNAVRNLICKPNPKIPNKKRNRLTKLHNICSNCRIVLNLNQISNSYKSKYKLSTKRFSVKKNMIKNIFRKFRNCHIFYHYNYNFNDWWHRWWWWPMRFFSCLERKRLLKHSYIKDKNSDQHLMKLS